MIDQLEKDLDHTFNMLSEKEKTKLSNGKILVTGSAGFIGFYLSHFLYKFRDKLNLKKVVLLDNFIIGRPVWQEKFLDDSRFTFEKFDIIKDKIEDIPAAQEINFVVHMARLLPRRLFTVCTRLKPSMRMLGDFANFWFLQG